MNLRQIEAFRRIMIAGSITGAAEAMHVSQPAVSRLLAELERSTGLALFERRSGRIHATQEAKSLYEEVERAFAGLDRIASRAQEIREYRHARLRIAAMPGLCLEVVPHVLAGLLAEFPEMSVALQARSSSQVTDWIEAGQFDLGLVGPPPESDGIRTLGVIRAPCVAAVAPGHPLAGQEYIGPSDLHCARVITMSVEQSSRRDLDRVLHEWGIEIAVQIETPLSYVAGGLARYRLGVAVIDPMTARMLPDLVIQPFRPEVWFSFAVICPAGYLLSREDRAFVEAFIDHIRSLDVPDLRMELPS